MIDLVVVEMGESMLVNVGLCLFGLMADGAETTL